MIGYLKRNFITIDKFGQPIRLNYKGNETFNTYLGSTTTIIIYIFLAITFWILFQDCLNHVNPLITFNKEYQNNPMDHGDKINFTQTYLNFRVGVIGEEKDNSLYKIDYTSIIDLTPYLEFSTNPSIIHCNNSKIHDGKIFSNIDYCVNYTEVIDPDDRFYNKLWEFMFQINYCKSFNHITCKSRKEINQFIKDRIRFIQFKLEVRGINPSNYENPFPLINLEIIEAIKPEYKISRTVELTPHKLFTDDGLIYPKNNSNTSSDSYMPVSDGSSMYNIYPLNDYLSEYLYSYELKESKMTITYNRKYQKISDVLANVSSIKEIVFLVFGFIMDIYCNFQREEKISNYIYKFDWGLDKKSSNEIRKMIELKNNINPINSNNSKNPNDPSSSNNSIKRNIHNDQNNYNKKSIVDFNNIEEINIKLGAEGNIFESKKKENIMSNNNYNPVNNAHLNQSNQIMLSYENIKSRKSEKKFRFSLFNLIYYYLSCNCCSNKVSNIKLRYVSYLKVQEAMTNILDIKRILHKIEEFDDLKMVLLNNEQIALFNFITKYNLLGELSNTNSKYDSDKNFLKNEKNLHKIVNELLLKIKNMPDNSTIESITLKLVDYLDIDILA